MEKGNIVTIRDNSYTQSVVDGKLVHERLDSTDKIEEQYVVVGIGCRFPAIGNQAREPASFNNTVIQAVDSGKVMFIEERFLRLVKPTHKVMVDMEQRGIMMLNGTLHEISDELYRKIKNEQS